MKTRSAQKKLERAIQWEKDKVEKAMEQVILAKVVPLTTTLIDIAENDRNPQAINSLLDRVFGKARQNIGLDGGAKDKPIVFMPAQLMDKYAIERSLAEPVIKDAIPSSTSTDSRG